MSDCPRLPNCAYYRLEKIAQSAVGKIMQECYCHGVRQGQCERLMYLNAHGEAPAEEMSPDKNLNAHTALYSDEMEGRIDRTMKALKKNGFEVKYFDQRDEAKDYILSQCRHASSISHGGSMTLEELGLFDQLIAAQLPFFNYSTPENRLRSLTAELYLTSSNAVTEDGRLVNIDGTGNRVAAISFGPKKVMVVVGTNKLVTTVEKGIERIRQISAPFNAMRLKKKVPCVVTGHCVDCQSPERICRTTVITDFPIPGRIEVILIDESLGF